MIGLDKEQIAAKSLLGLGFLHYRKGVFFFSDFLDCEVLLMLKNFFLC